LIEINYSIYHISSLFVYSVLAEDFISGGK